MNRQELITQISESTGESKAAVGRFLESFIDIVQTAVASGDKVSLVGFGNFESAATSAREGRNPATGETITIEASVRPKFSAGATFKTLVKEAAAKKSKKKK